MLPILKTSFISGCLCLAINSTAHADWSENETQQLKFCTTLATINSQAEQHYKKAQYLQARKIWTEQVGYMESCLRLKEDPSDLAKQIFTAKNSAYLSQNSLDTLYNSIALTYIKTHDYGKAKAWLSLAPKSAKTAFNLKLIPQHLTNNSVAGEYWMYAGLGTWQTYTVKAQTNQQYYIHFEGLYFGLNGLLYGPNLGEYDYQTKIQQQQSIWTYPDHLEHEFCRIQLKFQGDRLRATTSTNGSPDSSCGFGHNVTADGEYIKVS